MSLDKKSKKKSPVKAAPKRSVKKIPPPNRGGGNGPFYVLVIIILITVIVLLLNKYYENGKFSLPSMKIRSEKNDSAADKKNISKEDIIDNKSLAEEDINKNIDSKLTQNDDNNEKDEKPSVRDRDVSLYFLKLDDKSEKIYLSSVKRKLPDNQLLALTMEQLIKGPTAYEKGRGYITAVPSNLMVRGINIKGKTAEIDFNGVIEDGAAGDILLKRIQQIVHTATQFAEVDSIIIKINGERRKTIGGDGFSIGGPLGR